jgi:transcription elongation factor S-II
VVIGKLRANPNKDIAKLAGEIVSKWRKLVDAEKAAKAARSKRASPSTAPASATASPAPPTLGGQNKPYEGDVEKRHFKTDKVDVNRTSSDSRNNCIGLMYNGLAYRSKESVEDVLIRAMEVESAAYKSCKGETEDYRKKIRSLFTNLKNKTNRQLGKQVMAGEIPADKFVTMSDKELASAEQRAKDEALERENMKKAQVPMAEKSISDALRCGKCGQKKVSYSQAQTRSADEPMTTFCECTVCGNRWKVSTPLPLFGIICPLIHTLYSSLRIVVTPWWDWITCIWPSHSPGLHYALGLESPDMLHQSKNWKRSLGVYSAFTMHLNGFLHQDTAFCGQIDSPWTRKGVRF